MGTVQDPLRSIKLSLVTAEESPKHLCKQASIESNSNGYPFTAKDQLSGGCLLEVNSGREANVPKSDWHCEYDTKHPNILSPGSFSSSKEGSMAAPEPVSYAKQEGSRAKVQTPAPEAHTSEHGEVKVPLTQEANQNIPSGSGQSCNIIDKATILPGGDLDVTESKSKDYSILPSLPIYSDIQQASTVGKDNMCEVIISETSQVLVSSDEMGLNPKAPVGVETELGNTKDANICPKTEPQAASEFSLKSTPETSCTSSEEPTAKVVPNLSKFKDTGTMTVKPENRSVEAETISRTHQDAEVQAVASVESRSASTSPSILTAFLRENMSPEVKQDQDQLHVIYTGARGKEQSEIIGDFAATVQTPSSIGIMHKVHVQIPPATENPLGSPNIRLQENLTNMHDPICAALLDKAERVCSSDDSQETLAKRTEVQTMGVAKIRGDVPQQLSDNSVLQKTRPVSQISLSSSHPPVSTQHPANVETKLPPCFATPTINSKYQPANPSSFQEHPLPLCLRTSEQAKAIVISMDTERTYQEKQLQIKTVANLETALPSFPIAVNPKREGKVHLISAEQKINMTGSIFGSQTTSAPVVAESKQNTVPGDAKAETLASQNPISKLSRSFGAALGIQNDKIQKSPVLGVPAAPTSSSPTPRLGEKKKGPKAFAAEAKVHLKQSKRVKDVVWDEQGMTWEVYGASLDPESLGIAIQNHLQRQIREHEKLIKAQSPQSRKSISSDTSSNKKLKGRQHNVFHSMLQNFRRPNCCVRPAASSVLD